MTKTLMFSESIVICGSALRSDRHMRWICAREALLLQGIPIFATLSSGVEVTGFASCKSSIRDTGRTATIGQAGNAMHSQCIAIALMYVVTQSNPPASLSVPPTLSSSNVHASSSSSSSGLHSHKTSMESDRDRNKPRDVKPLAQTEHHRTSEGAGSSSVSFARLMWMYSNNAKSKR